MKSSIIRERTIQKFWLNRCCSSTIIKLVDFYLLRKNLHNTAQAKLVMSKLYNLFYLLDVTGDDCITALSSDIKDYEDAVVSCCSYRNQMQYIEIRNTRDYHSSKVRAILPDDIIKLITANK